MQIDQAFERVWQAREDIHAGQMSCEGRAVSEEAARQAIRDWMDTSKPTNYQYLLALSPRLQGDKLLDVFSGPAIIPISLQVAGLVKEATLVDHDPWNQFSDLYRQYGSELGIDPPQVSSREIGAASYPLPNIENVTLIDTGLGLPHKDRAVLSQETTFNRQAQQQGISNVRRRNPSALLRGHVFNLELSDVLTLLSDTKRRVFIAENSNLRPETMIEEVRSHLALIVDEFGGEWSMGEVEKLPHPGLLLAGLNHR